MKSPHIALFAAGIAFAWHTCQAADLVEVKPVFVQAVHVAPPAAEQADVQQASHQVDDPVPAPFVPEPTLESVPHGDLESVPGGEAMLPLALEEACCCPASGWTVAVDYVLLDRTSENRVLYNVFDPNTPDRPGPPAMYTPDFDFEPGVRIRALYQTCCAYDLELIYLGMQEWNGSAAIEGTPPPPPYQMNYLYDIAFDVDAAAVHYQADLDSFEANLRTCYSDCLTLLMGVRYIDIDEGLLFEQIATNGALEESLGTRTQNDLLGIQIGGEYLAWNNCQGHAIVSGKAGVLANDQSVSSFYDTNAVLFLNDTAARDSNNEASFFLELGVTGKYCINSCLSLRGGYQLLYVTDVATAISQLDSTQLDPNFPVTVHVGTDEVLYHGGFIGLELSL